MATPLSNDQQIFIAHRHLPANTAMDSMEMATDHYNISFVVSGDRTTITPTQMYTFHTGNVAVAPPFMYHRTIPNSDTPYESYFIKFTPAFIQPLIDTISPSAFEALYEEKVFTFDNSVRPIIKQMFMDMEAEYQKNTPYKNLILQGMLFRLFTTIIETRLPDCRVVTHASHLTKPIMEAVCYIETHYSENISLQLVAEHVNLSTAYLSRLFSAQLGMSYSNYLNNVRIRHAKHLLSNTNKTIMEIALETGFCNGDYLSTCFKEKTGLSPKHFRNLQHN